MSVEKIGLTAAYRWLEGGEVIMEELILIMLVGLPRSGKSTWARKQGFPIVNPDAIRLAVYGKRFWKEGEPMVWAVAHLMVNSLFGSGHNVVILDATNLTEKRRAEWTNSTTYNVAYQVFDTPANECVIRAEKLDDPTIIPIILEMDMKKEPLLADSRLWEHP